MKKRLLITIVVFVMMLVLTPGEEGRVCAQALTCSECGSDDIQIWKSDIEKYSSARHAVTYEYTCWNCGNVGSGTAIEAHNWKLVSDDEYKGSSTCTYFSPTKHKKHLSYICKECETEKTETVSVNHTYLNGGCKYCTYPTGNRTLQSGQWTCYSGSPWMRIVVKKNGYLSFQGNGFYNVYNKSQKKYKNEIIEPGDNYGTDYLPVKKGTYYIRPGYPTGNRQLKYTFRGAKKRKNYTIKKAIKVKKNKTAIASIFARDKRKTWRRWYKIRITKKRKIRLWKYGGEFEVYKGKTPVAMNYVSTSKDGSLYLSGKKLKKGTYYICFYDSWKSVEKKQSIGELIQFRWNYK